MSLLEHTYQASDLAGSGRKEFIERARNGCARLRHPDGTPLVMLPEGDLTRLRYLGQWMRAYLALETAMGRPRAQRLPADFGDIAWAITLDEDDLHEFQAEFRDELVLAASRGDAEALARLIRDWQYTADSLADPVSGPIHRRQLRDVDFVEANEPTAPLAEGA